MNQVKESFDLVLFGARGDLARRKLVPALFSLFAGQQMPDHWSLVGVGRTEMERDAYLQLVRDSLGESPVPEEELDAHWHHFARHIDYCILDVSNAEQVTQLRTKLDASAHTLFYLATPAELYTHIAHNLNHTGLINERSRVVLEKPIGLDLDTAREISAAIGTYFDENQIYRIDHYLGKETVQNLLVLRFANTIFETQWNHRYIDHIQITISESIGVEGRADFYESTGALRDMVQNHLLQLLCITAMEPPHRLHPDAVRDEKVKVLRALRPLDSARIPARVVRGQYRAGSIDGQPVKGYLDEQGVDPTSRVETYVAMKVEIENWRWAGVPFYLRTGKRLGERACEIAVHFKEVPHSIFELQHRSTMANRLVFRLQPDEGISLSLCEKQTGAGMSVQSSELSLSPDRMRRLRVPDAYERLLADVIAGNQTLFVRDDELMAAWEWLDPVIRHWEDSEQRPEFYTAGTWGPPAATLLLARDGRLWDEVGEAGTSQKQY
ncbi:glucose-6-phosphate dehydrogenase [Marinobacteraceae bacterium S3BR75-40.1]